MNEILINTRKRINIDLLRARDFWFNRARRWGWCATALSIVPILLTIFSYLPIPALIDFFDKSRDVIVGVAALIFFIACIPIERVSDKYRSVSNEFRERYDINVLDLPLNPFLFSAELPEGKKEAMLKEGARRYRDHQKYEAWYEEVFSTNPKANVICCQMDNALYTYYVYTDTERFYKWCTIVFLLTILLLALAFRNGEVLILVTVSSFAILTECLRNIQEIREQLNTLSNLHNTTKVVVEKLKTEEEYNLFIRELQDSIAEYRKVSAYVPRFIRLKYLKEDSPYYADLNELKACLYKDLDVTRPENAKQIVIMDETESEECTLEDVQCVLREMLKDMVEAFDAKGIAYTLDGGSLIGAKRANENGHFVFWDDDIDVVLPVSCIDEAKDAIRDRYGNKYAIQDYENDPAYSPRLSIFRIRHLRSETTEKDSLLYENYVNRGIFIDVYAYSPILVCRWVDAVFRRIFLHPLNYRILKAENRAVRNVPAHERIHSSEFKRFLQLKKKYLRRTQWYLGHAKNSRYVSYVPTYIYNLGAAGPYIAEEYVKPAVSKVSFEGVKCAVPQNHDAVLRAYYGDWERVPFRTVEQMKAAAKEKGKPDEWYSEFIQAVTPLKHLRNVKLS